METCHPSWHLTQVSEWDPEGSTQLSHAKTPDRGKLRQYVLFYHSVGGNMLRSNRKLRYPPTGHIPVHSLTLTLLFPIWRYWHRGNVNPEDICRAGDSEHFSQPQTGEELPLPSICLRHSTRFLNLRLGLTSLCSLLGSGAKMAAVASYWASQSTDLGLEIGEISFSWESGQDQLDFFFFLKETSTWKLRGQRRKTRYIDTGHISNFTKGQSQPSLAGASPGLQISASLPAPAPSVQEAYTVPGSCWHSLRLSWHFPSPETSLPGPPGLVSSRMNKVLPLLIPNNSCPWPHTGDLTRQRFASLTIFSPLCSCVLLLCSDLLGFDSPRKYLESTLCQATLLNSRDRDTVMAQGLPELPKTRLLVHD